MRVTILWLLTAEVWKMENALNVSFRKVGTSTRLHDVIVYSTEICCVIWRTGNWAIFIHFWKFWYPFPPPLRFDPIPCHGLPLRGLTITLRHTTLGKNSPDDWFPDTVTSTWLHTTLTTDSIHAAGGIRTRSPSKRAAADRYFGSRGHRFQPYQSELQCVSWHWQCRTGSCHWTQTGLLTATSIESLEMWVSTSQSHCTWCYTIYPSRDTAIQLLWVCGHLATQWLFTGNLEKFLINVDF